MQYGIPGHVVVLLLCLCLAGLIGCGGGKIVTAKDLPAAAEPALKGPASPIGRSSVLFEELRLSEELEGVSKIDAQDYIRNNPEKNDSIDYYCLGAEDVIQVDFLYVPEMSGKVTILPDGTANLPLVGKVPLAGLTLEQTLQKIVDSMQQSKMLTSPQVSVALLELKSRKVRVFGAVGSAGQYSLNAGQRLLDIVTQAGGVDFAKDSTLVYVLRRTGEDSRLAIQINLNDLMRGREPALNILLRDDDVIYIPRAKRYMVMGEVKTPGIYTLDRSRRISILEAIIQAGGFSPYAAKNKVWIHRVCGPVNQEIRIRVGDLMKGGQRQTVYIEEDDTIIVPESMF